MNNIDKAVIIQCKKLVQEMLDSFKVIEKHAKKTKQSKKITKLMQEFINCHLDNPAIVTKYSQIMELIKGFKK